MIDINDFVGLPYREGARGPREFDCYGLVMAVMAAARGVSLPDWHQAAAGQQAASRAIAAAVAGETAGGRAELVYDPEDFDVAVVGSNCRPHHVGIVWGRGILHASKTFGSAWHQFSRFRLLYPAVEFYRWRP